MNLSFHLFQLLLFLITASLATNECGTRLSETKRRQKRMIGGNLVTTSKKWPWQVYLQITPPEGPSKACGGTIVSDRWILTAAHCVQKIEGGTFRDILVIAGVTDGNAVTIVNSLMNNRALRATRIIPHKNFKHNTFEDDIALLQLDTALQFDHSVSSICLPNLKQVVPPDGQAVGTGFGYSNIRGTDKIIHDNKLREAILPIIRDDVCEERHKSANFHHLSQWTKNNLICAGSMGHDAGKGDSGGPLMMKASDGRWFQIGLVSFGTVKSIEADKIPGAYTDVREYCEWINETTEGEVKCQEETVTLQDVEMQM